MMSEDIKFVAGVMIGGTLGAAFPILFCMAKDWIKNRYRSKPRPPLQFKQYLGTGEAGTDVSVHGEHCK